MERHGLLRKWRHAHRRPSVTLYYYCRTAATFTRPPSWWHIPGAASNPLKSFASFSATAWNFSVNFYKSMWLSCLHQGKQSGRHLIIFKQDEVIDILAWRFCDFRALKYVCVETQRNEIPSGGSWLYKRTLRIQTVYSEQCLSSRSAEGRSVLSWDR